MAFDGFVVSYCVSCIKMYENVFNSLLLDHKVLFKITLVFKKIMHVSYMLKNLCKNSNLLHPSPLLISDCDHSAALADAIYPHSSK